MSANLEVDLQRTKRYKKKYVKVTVELICRYALKQSKVATDGKGQRHQV